jgi:hypothetical protein
MLVQLNIFSNGAWVKAGDARSYDAATVEELCARIGATLVEGDFIQSPAGVYVDSYYGFLTLEWLPFSRLGQISTDQMSLRIGQHVEAAESIVGTKRKVDVAQLAASRPKREHVGPPKRYDDSAELLVGGRDQAVLAVITGLFASTVSSIPSAKTAVDRRSASTIVKGTSANPVADLGLGSASTIAGETHAGTAAETVIVLPQYGKY